VKIISVKVTANSKNPRIEIISDRDEKGREFYKIYVRAQAAEGKANQELIRSFAEYFDIPKSKIEIIKGLTSKEKVLQIQI